jgi:hypothetical protein
MKVVHTVLVIMLALTLTAGLQAKAAAGQGGADSITITIDRNVMPVSIFHAGLFWTKPETVTVRNFVIRNYAGKPIDGFVVQTASAQTKVPIGTVQEIKHTGWIRKDTQDIPHINYVVPVHMVLTDGRVLDTLMNADFGTIEGLTDLGKFFVADPHTVTHLAFNRTGLPPTPPPAEQMLSPEGGGDSDSDSDSDGVSDAADRCPDTPAGIAVDEFGCPLDSDGDGVPDYLDNCPDTPAGAGVDEKGCPLDSDADGVADYLDECPDTPAGALVDATGCWVIKGINFDYDKWDVKPQFYPVLDADADVLQKNPSLKIEVRGHTDSIASEAYNQGLSEKRADSARSYLTSKGIEMVRISTKGFGESKPIASNDTPEGRSENRRIEIRILGQ